MAGGARTFYDAQLHLMDRQIVDTDGRLVAKVDDVELTEDPVGRLWVSGLLTGPGALGPRIHGRTGAIMFAVWRRLRADADPSPGRIAMSDVAKLDSAVHLNTSRDSVCVDGFETWMRRKVISLIPGAAHDPE